MTIYQAIAEIMKEVEAIGKNKENTTQHFKFRGIDDVYNALHPLLAKYGVFTVPEVLEDRSEDRQTKSGGTLIYRILKIKYHFFAADGSSIEAVVIGEGMDSGDKASNKAMSIAHKYAFFQVFSIPTDEVAASDPDNETPPESVKTFTPSTALIAWESDILGADDLPTLKKYYSDAVAQFTDAESKSYLNKATNKRKAELPV